MEWNVSDVAKWILIREKLCGSTEHTIGKQHPEKLYLPVEEGGKGLKSLTLSWEKEVVSVATYLLMSEHEQVQGAVRLLTERANGKARPEKLQRDTAWTWVSSTAPGK